MEVQEKMGTVYMKAFDALKRVCQENSMNRVIGSLLPKYEKILNNKIKSKEQIPMFTRDTRDQYIGEDILEELKNEKDSLEI